MKPISCGHLDDFLDGELALAAITAFEEHVEQCAACRRAVTQSRAVVRLLERAFNGDPAVGMSPAGFACQAAASPHTSRLRRFSHDSGRFAKAAACSAAVAAALLLWASASMHFGGRTGDAPRSLRAAQESVKENRGLLDEPAMAARVPTVAVELADDQELLAVRMPTRNESVTVVWMYPTVQ